jgi:hypothetical protein
MLRRPNPRRPLLRATGLGLIARLVVSSALLVAPWFEPGAARAQGPAIGVNVINPYVLSVADQDAMLAEIHGTGVRVIRASITLDAKGVDFAERAWKHGLSIEWLIYHFGGYDPFGQKPLSAADPEQFRKTFMPILEALEAKGITLAAFELGNEINLSGTNPEFIPRQGNARQLSLDDLDRDPEGRQVAKGFLQYLKVLAALKDVRDHSKLNRRTPITTAGLGTYDQNDGPMPKWAKGDVVGINTTLRYMRAHGLDTLVDAYGIHVYPDNHEGAAISAARKAKLDKYDLAECRPPGSSAGKPCWVTEWGLNNGATNCPLDDTSRARVTREMMGDFAPYARRGSLAGLVYFAWTGTPGSPPLSSALWRCGALSESGRAALDAALLK